MNTKAKFLIAAVMFTAAGSAVNAQGVSGSQESGYEIKAGEVTMTVSATEEARLCPINMPAGRCLRSPVYPTSTAAHSGPARR